MTSTIGPAPDNAPAVVTVDVAPATRVLVAGDLHLARRPTACSLAVAAELAAALDGWVGQGLLVLNGDVFDFADDAPQDPGRILDAHPRLAAALEQFASGEGRRVVFIVGTSDCTLVETGSRGAAVLRTRYDADVALAVRLRITTGAGQRLVRVEHGSRLGDDNDQPRSEAERLIGGGYAGLVTGHTHDPELTSLGSGFYANTGSCGTVVRPRQRRWGLSSVPVRRAAAGVGRARGGRRSSRTAAVLRASISPTVHWLIGSPRDRARIPSRSRQSSRPSRAAAIWPAPSTPSSDAAGSAGRPAPSSPSQGS